MKKQNNAKNVGIVLAAVFCLAALGVIFYYFQHASVTIGKYTVVYYKNRCAINPKDMPESYTSLTSLPCLIRINWRERISSDMEQEYCYLPNRGAEKTRLIHTSKR